MWIVQPSTLALILAAATLSTMVAAETTVTKETHPYKDTEQGKPANPLFACSVESRRCMYADDFTSLPYTGNLQLSTCHHDNALKQLGRWLFNPRHKFINSFWVYCYANDGDCQRYVGDHRGRLDEVAAVSAAQFPFGPALVVFRAEKCADEPGSGFFCRCVCG